MAPICIRKRGTEKFAKLLLFMYTVLESIRSTLNTWVAVLKSSVNLSKTFFHEVRGCGEGYRQLKELAQNKILTNCEPLTVGQRCADSFVLRQFRVTGSNAGIVLLRNNEMRKLLNLERCDVGEYLGPEKLFGLFYNILFGFKLSTKTMVRGSVDDDASIR